MKKYTLITLLIFLSAVTISCRKEIKSEKGGIDIISNVYFNASSGLDNMQTFHVSKLNYSQDDMIEIIPDLEFPEMNSQMVYIKDTLYYPLDVLSEPALFSEVKKRKPLLLKKKTVGTLFVDDKIPNYGYKYNLSDTVLFKKTYKRFEIKSKEGLARYYVYKTDTVLPYSLYKHVEKDYKGRIERIDSYNSEKDVFVTLQLIPRKKWDKEAEDIFKFNEFAEKRKK
ncbi:MAG: hypothetical protein QM564_06450 [Bergeyella sp.]